ncbi:MAG: RNA polymerase sigma-70 factor [Gemmatimonadetes bacterium]|nr:RNA polymerase sigma-70 factor [Gemmatimonadota bacterium]
MDRLRVGDSSALDELLALYWGRLVAYAQTLVVSEDAAEDIAQEAFMRLWERRSEWNPGSEPRPLLYRIVRNLALNELRWRNLRARWVERLAAKARPQGPSPVLAAEGEELRAAVARAVESLPPRRREVFVLARFHNLSYQGIAEVLGISAQTVANQMSAALSDLRGSLASFLEDEADGLSTGTSPRPA